jgi:hypothetical protein
MPESDDFHWAGVAASRSSGQYAIDPYRTVFARALVGIPYPFVVEIMVQ